MKQLTLKRAVEVINEFNKKTRGQYTLMFDKIYPDGRINFIILEEKVYLLDLPFWEAVKTTGYKETKKDL